MGDPAGIGPEVLLKSYKKAKETQNLVAVTVTNFGMQHATFVRTAHAAGLEL